MTVKKAIKKSIVTPIIKKIEDEYVEVFETITITRPVKVDLNWVSVRRKIQSINFFKWMKEEKKKTFKEKYGFDLWEIYCNWFNNTFNKKMNISDEEDYKKFERQIRGLKDE